ncbi:LytTR family DNA-binding domain-containing protein [Bacillus carboniphilus]|uniref:LytTR family DNA-binding domain-containing protein n=1 Tax=Bacillus carboniphilus TaxID=86663 RepID=A0ABY9JX83_9BACI|nr:LytTR family DNA-binding domain-containing protein [Bacillus carboniphilus]WLR43035.1 LytTR family DNA-binding domain-containing protein [Bacillus carboniphilus]
MSINILMIDDHEETIENLYSFLTLLSEVDKVYFSNHLPEISEALYKQHIDIIMVNIHATTVDGFLLCRNIIKTHPSVQLILTAQHKGDAIKGYEVDAVDYLVQPVNLNKLYLSIYKAISRIRTTDKQDRIGIKIKSSIKFVSINDIVFIERQGKKTFIFLTDNERIETNESLSALELRLQKYRFFRPHQSYLVSLNKIDEISPDPYMKSYNIKVSGSSDLVKVSKSKYQPLIKQLSI